MAVVVVVVSVVLLERQLAGNTVQRQGSRTQIVVGRETARRRYRQIGGHAGKQKGMREGRQAEACRSRQARRPTGRQAGSSLH